jgi:hypothetical protein
MEDIEGIPTEPLNPSKFVGAFRTHLRYLQAFDLLATRARYRTRETCEDLRARFFGSPAMPKIKSAVQNPTQVRSSLQNAWGTELLLCLGHHFLRADEIIKLSNTWNVVQAYYSVYHATQAILVARGTDRPDSHPKTQRAFVDLWGKLPEAFMPWCLSFGPDGYRPANIVIDGEIHSWTFVDPNNCTSLACKALRTTREDAFPDRIRAARDSKKRAKRQAWQEEENTRLAAGNRARKPPKFALPQLSPEERAAAEQGTRNYSMLDYLYRLRIRTNYGEAAMFTDGPENEAESKAVRVSLIRIVAKSIYAAELMIETAPDGRDLLREWGSKWSETNIPKDMEFGVRQRIPYW